VRFRDDERVTVTDPSDRHYEETGVVEDHYLGMSGATVYLILLDGRADPLPFLEPQLALGERTNA